MSKRDDGPAYRVRISNLVLKMVHVVQQDVVISGSCGASISGGVNFIRPVASASVGHSAASGATGFRGTSGDPLYEENRAPGHFIPGYPVTKHVDQRCRYAPRIRPGRSGLRAAPRRPHWGTRQRHPSLIEMRGPDPISAVGDEAGEPVLISAAFRARLG